MMLVFSLTPLHSLLWGSLMGLPPQLLSLSRDATLIMCLMPAIIIYRNYFHSQLMMARQTSGMAYGSIVRVIGIYACAQILFSLGWLDHVAATFILILGFVIEAIIARMSSRRAALLN
jgi:hypothetical protein